MTTIRTIQHRGFHRPTREGENAIAKREKACADFLNKYFAYFKRSQRFAIGLEKLQFFSSLSHE